MKRGRRCRAAWHGVGVQVRIVGTDLPGRSFGAHGQPGIACYQELQVGVQRGRRVEQLVPGDADRAVFTVELRPKGERDAVGPHAQGRPGERFVYLVWVHGPEREMFRRAKLLLADVPTPVWAAGVSGATLRAELALTDERGGPRCARIPPDLVRWSAG